MRSLVDRLRSWLSSPRAPTAIVLLAVLVGLPSLAGGLAVDDHWHKIMLTPDPAWSRLTKPWYELFSFYDGNVERTHRILDLGLSPWWTDPEIRLAFFRPVTAVTHVLDYALWPSHPWMMHAHSLVWLAALVAVATWAYRRLLPGWAGGLAALLFALDHNHGIPIAWIANRNSLVAGVFAIAALGTYDVAVRAKRAAPLWTLGSALLLALALGSGESAVATLGYLVAYAVVLDTRALRARLVSLAPHASVTAVWTLLYRVGGFGAHGSGIYIEPARDPLAFGSAVAKHLPMLLASELGAPTPDLYAFVPLVAKVAFVTGALLFLAWSASAIVRVWRVDPVARFLVLGSVLATLPGCATFPSSRLLVVPGFGLLGLVALVAANVADEAAWVPRSGVSRRLVRSFAIWACGGHLVLSPVALQVTMQQLPMLNRVIARLGADLPTAPSPTVKRILLLNVPDAVFAPYFFLGRSSEVSTAAPRLPAPILTMATGARDLDLRRTDEHTVVMRVESGFYRVATELVTRTEAVPMHVGDTLALTDVTVEVLAVAPDGVPTEASFRFAESVDAEAYLWERWSGEKLVAVRPPAIGAHVAIPGQFAVLF